MLKLQIHTVLSKSCFWRIVKNDVKVSTINKIDIVIKTLNRI